MVRVNIIKPEFLLDQHLLAEWNEIQMLFGYTQKHPDCVDIPQRYKLGKGHIKFFKDKIAYLYKRLYILKEEAQNRGYFFKDVLEINSSYNIPNENFGEWTPQPGDKDIIIERLLEKHAMQPNWYTYYGKTITVYEYKQMLQKASD